MSLRIDPATPADVPAILQLVRELAEFERLLHEVVATEADCHEALFGSRPVAEAVVGRAGGEVAGFALFFQNYSTFRGRPGLYLEDLYVRPQHRGRGYGRALLTHLAALAVRRRCARMEWSVLDWNAPAIRFYESLGARPVDGWKVYRLTGEALLQAGLAGEVDRTAQSGNTG
jgi:GNAT superfamily N-acetyltransferase